LEETGQKWEWKKKNIHVTIAKKSERGENIFINLYDKPKGT
jgi:hypothetical protein